MSSGILRGEISSAWTPQDQFSDSSFGFERWYESAGSSCHYGVLLKANGVLAILSSRPDKIGKCSGDPEDQIYQRIPNWDTIRADKTISFALNWSPENVSLQVSSNGREESTSYSGSAIPSVPLGIRLYAQAGEKYTISELHRC